MRRYYSEILKNKTFWKNLVYLIFCILIILDDPNYYKTMLFLVIIFESPLPKLVNCFRTDFTIGAVAAKQRRVRPSRWQVGFKRRLIKVYVFSLVLLAVILFLWHHRQEVRQRSAKPLSPVQIRVVPPKCLF